MLDTSASVQFLGEEGIIYTADTALPYVKKASKKFVADINKASGNNYIAIVAYGGSSTRVISNFFCSGGYVGASGVTLSKKQTSQTANH